MTVGRVDDPPAHEAGHGRTPLNSSDERGHRLRRNVTVGDRRTSVSLEDHMWDGLTEICRREAIGIDTLCTEVDRRRSRSSMSSALRVLLLLYFRGLSDALGTGVDPEDGRLAAALQHLRRRRLRPAAARGGAGATR